MGFIANIKRSGSLMCGGSLVAPGYVVSAAHCEYNIPSRLTVTVGDVTLSRTESSEQVFNVVQQVPHEQYSSSNQQNDIMIIVLSGTANLNSYVSLVQLPTANVDVAVGTECTVYGWEPPHLEAPSQTPSDKSPSQSSPTTTVIPTHTTEAKSTQP